MPIYVGQDRICFHVYEDILCTNSEFFDAALASEFREGIEKCVNLPEESPTVFNFLVQWLYSGVSAIGFDAMYSPKFFYDEICDLYRLARRYIVPILEEHIVKVLYACAHENRPVPSPAQMSILWEESAQNSGIRRLLTDWCTACSSISWFEGEEDESCSLETSPEMVVAILVTAKRCGFGNCDIFMYEDHYEQYLDDDEKDDGQASDAHD